MTGVLDLQSTKSNNSLDKLKPLNLTFENGVNVDKPEVSYEEFMNEADPAKLDSIEETPIGPFIYAITLAVALGGALFGYDSAVISGVLVTIDDALGKTLTTGEKELITSIMSAGAFVGGIVGGVVIDRIGRRIPLLISSVLFIIGSIIQASAFELIQMSIGRFVVGLGVGLAPMIVPVFIAELSPAKLRGKLITLDSICITGFQVIAYLIDFAFQNVKGGWRYMVGAAAIPAMLFGISVYMIPDTPRFLIEKDRYEEATAVIRKIYPNATEAQVKDKVSLISSSFHFESESVGQYTVWQRLKLLYTNKFNLKALIVACGLMGIQQFAGSNTITFYAPTLFSLVGFSQPIAVSIVTSGANCIFTVVSLFTVDRFGRRRLLVSTVWIMTLFLVIAAVSIHYIPINSNLELDGAPKLTWAGILLLISIIGYIAGYAVGLGNVAWFGGELFPMEVRSIGATMLNCTCWGSNVVVSSTYLSMMKHLTPSGAFGFYIGTTFVGWLCIIFFYPEVTDMTLEEIKEVFNHGFGVRYSSKLRKERLKKRLEDEGQVDLNEKSDSEHVEQAQV
ncbi:Myo-inositol transporter 1 [Wickerhamomyces ciferrii]|uniref:Myo-inositol transporter 1 n=1 Tax=Wickerhamomyces ciferrii (strain ATCC 14091 / BCRC 22168 / CBS 111 / JCM 3599 / NBRC 0793 / NRRL Y-1031 F-60-10) TaxID=1206466 RepID=K0KNA0_WICCF|nr:Myo-inositol transporter 1 [Wickerhamomyces ciferrii]CCH42839.1 Myo-inositol transporter 1 [Wickerhamomyces ciferrii]